jgi:hypothetical protein
LRNNESTKSLLKTISKSKLKDYSDEERLKTDEKVEEILKEKKRIYKCRHFLLAITACNTEGDTCR